MCRAASETRFDQMKAVPGNGRHAGCENGGMKHRKTQGTRQSAPEPDQTADFSEFSSVLTSHQAANALQVLRPASLLTIAEAAALLRVNVKTIHGMIAEGLPHLRPSKRIIRIERAVLLSWRKVA
jgi:excisionase family DNA binding protein